MDGTHPLFFCPIALLMRISGDIVSLISTRHLMIADQSEEGSLDERCLRLAELAAHSVDFVKSGVPVNIRDLPRASSKVKPDFLASASDDPEKDCYPSMKALGQMFRAVPVCCSIFCWCGTLSNMVNRYNSLRDPLQRKEIGVSSWFPLTRMLINPADNRVDASVLYKILEAVRLYFPQYSFSPPSKDQAHVSTQRARSLSRTC